MSNSIISEDKNVYKLFLFSFLIAVITYGFSLINFTISIDNEMPILSDYGLDLGRWGHNLILYHLFGGHLQYFTLILSLLLFSIAAVQISKLFKFKGFSAYVFCGLFITFPQLSYQVVFGMMAVIASLSVLLSAFSIYLFLKGFETKSLSKKIALFLAVAIILMFTLSMYQAFIFISITLYVILFFQNTFEDSFKISLEIKKTLFFGLVVLLSGLLYYISVKIICPLQKGGYIDSFISGESDNQLLNFCSIWLKNLVGSFYYGSTTFSIATLASIILFVRFFIEKKHLLFRFVTLFFIILIPFVLSSVITNGYHPPRIYLTSNLVFAFLIVFTINYLNISSLKTIKTIIFLILIIHIYFVTNLFYSANKIYKHDRKIAEKIDSIIQINYPTFFTTKKSIYFYGYFPYDYHQKFRLEKSEIFGGSFYCWDNGNNYRIINFFKAADVAEYTMITKENFDAVKDSIPSMPIWPNPESVKMINNTVIVKLGNDKGMPLYFE